MKKVPNGDSANPIGVIHNQLVQCILLCAFTVGVFMVRLVGLGIGGLRLISLHYRGSLGIAYRSHIVARFAKSNARLAIQRNPRGIL